MSACAKFQSKLHGNRDVILVVGGSGQPTAVLLDYTQQNAQWTTSEYHFKSIFCLYNTQDRFIYQYLHLFVLATNPPTDHTSSFDHHNALTDLSGQGVYMQHEKYLYHFTCDESSCEWEIMQQQFGKSLYDPVMMYLPSSYGCSNSVTTTTTSPTTTGTLTTTTTTTSTTITGTLTTTTHTTTTSPTSK